MLRRHTILLRVITLGLLFYCFSSNSFAQNFNYPGGIVDLSMVKESDDLPMVKFGLQEVAVLDQRTHWRLLVGIDLATVPGDYLLYIKSQTPDSLAYSQKFQVIQKQSAAFNGKLTDTLANPITHRQLSDINFTNSVQPELPLLYPSNGKWADYFGQFNQASLKSGANKDISSRNYISLTTTELLTVVAPQNAIVSRILEEPTPPNSSAKRQHTLFLDHGRGLYSILFGITDVTIEVGNGVQAGAVLGKLYSNENSEPSTLIWQTVLNGAYVNPTILTQLEP